MLGVTLIVKFGFFELFLPNPTSMPVVSETRQLKEGNEY